jgi:folylpolyglutamate synthase
VFFRTIPIRLLAMHLFLNLNTICVLIIDFLHIQVFPFPIQDGIPAFTVPQPDEAMNVLVEKASKLNVSCIFHSPGSSIFHFSGKCLPHMLDPNCGD